MEKAKKKRLDFINIQVVVDKKKDGLHLSFFLFFSFAKMH